MRNYNEQEQKLADKMMELGLNISAKGFNYILDAVKLIHDTDDCIGIIKLYESIAQKNNISAYKNVERCIRSEIDRI